MGLLIAGMLLWTMVHLMKSVTPGLRGGIIGAIGAGPHKGLVTLSLLGALALIIFGWRSAIPLLVYDPPGWGRHANMTIMFFAILFFATAQGKSRVRQMLRHPMLTGMLLFCIAHLLANGDQRSLVLFGGLGFWALISIFTISRIEGPWQKPAEVAGFGRELITLVAVSVVYTILLWTHVYFAGVPLIPN